MTRKKILHYTIRPTLARCHVPFVKDVEHDHYWLVPKNLPKWFYQMVPKSKIIQCDQMLRHPTHVMGLIIRLKPDIILCSDHKIPPRLLADLASHYQLWVINHGIWCPGILDRRQRKGSTYGNLNVFHKIFYTPLELNYIKPFTKPQQLVPVNGYIGLDLLQQTKEELEPNPNENIKKILLVANKTGFTDKVIADNHKTYREYSKILDTLSLYVSGKQYKIICKMKPTRDLELMMKKSKTYSKNTVEKATGHDLIYKYLLEAHIVIIQGYSTVLIEALTLNKPVILCQIPKGQDFLNFKDYPNLMCAYSIKELQSRLDQIDQDQKHQSPEYQLDRTKYLKKHLGAVKCESIVELISKHAHSL